VAEAAKCFSNYELSLLVVKPIVLFGYWLNVNCLYLLDNFWISL
jgi:hypothetical protein